MELEELRRQLEELRRQLEDKDLDLEQKVHLLNDGLNKALNMAALQTDRHVMAAVKSHLYLSGVLHHCVLVLSGDVKRLGGNWDAAATLAQLTSTCCVGAEPGSASQAFHRLFLPSVMEGLLSLAGELTRRAEGTQCVSVLSRVMEAVALLLRGHSELTCQVLSSAHYEHIQMCDDVRVSLLCVQMWIQTCSASRDFLSGLSDDSILLLLNEAVGQLAVSTDSSVGEASVRLILLMANQELDKVQPLLLSFRGLDSLLDKDWRGRSFDQELDQLIGLIQSETRSLNTQVCPEQAARTLQRAVRRFLQRRRAAKLPPTTSFWIGQDGLTDGRRVELKRQVEEHVSLHPSTRVSQQECKRLHEEVQLLVLSELQRGGDRRREEQRVEAVLAHTHTQLELLRDAPPLSVVTTTAADSFLSPSGPIAARALQAHNAALQASGLPWWRTPVEEASGGHLFSPSHLQELEAELGGLFVGGLRTDP